jgi:hypothetical protein
MREILVATKKERYWATAKARRKHNCPQYDSFMRIEVFGKYWRCSKYLFMI